MKKRFLTVFLALVMCLGLAAPAFAAVEEFVIDENGVLTHYIGPGGDVVIPDSVTRFGRAVFRNCAGLTAIPKGVTQLTDNMFSDCTGLTEIVIPDGVIKLGVYTFVNCTNLVSVTIPGSVTEIEDSAFAFCSSLREIVIPDGVTKIGFGAFQYCTSLTSAVIPDGVTEISEDTFIGCHSLTDVTIPDSVTKIDAGAFSGTPWLKQQGDFPVFNGVLLAYQGEGGGAVIPEGVTEIGRRAFSECPVTSVTVSEGVTRIADNAFSLCHDLARIELSPGIEQIGDYAFVGCTGLTAIYIPPSVTQIGTNAFACTEGVEEKPYGWLTFYYVSDSLTIYGEPDSYAETYARENGIPFAAGAAPRFTDLKLNAFYLDAVDWAVANRVTTGKTPATFAPNLKCSHSEILTFLWRAFREPESSAQPPIDMKGDEFYYKAVKWAAEKGMIGGDFDPKALCTRSDAVNYIWQAFGRPAAEYDGRFTDVPTNSSYAAAVAWAVEKGVTNGKTATSFNPGGVCTRGEIVTFLYRAYK